MSLRILLIGAGSVAFAGAGVYFAGYGNSPGPRTRTGSVPQSPASMPATPGVSASAIMPVVWPTPYPGLEKPDADIGYLQATASGDPRSGSFGMVRSGGAQFHEGWDIRPVARDKRGEATDPIVAVIPGRIVHANAVANGAYGRYVVIEHAVSPGLTLYSLYAHLAQVTPGLKPGNQVAAGDKLGIMGRSDGKGGFPRERAHLHFEIGLRLGDRFDRWYAAQKIPDPNLHGNFNGLNLAGLNPAGLFRLAREHRGKVPAAELVRWVREQPVAVVVETPATLRLPNFLSRATALGPANQPAQRATGWRIGFTVHGAPVKWEPIVTAPAQPRLVLVDATCAAEARRRNLISTDKRGRHEIDKTLATALALTLE